MATAGTVTVQFKAETDGLIQFARIIQKHMGALADDLEKLRDGEGTGPDEDAGREILEDRPWKRM